MGKMYEAVEILKHVLIVDILLLTAEEKVVGINYIKNGWKLIEAKREKIVLRHI